MLASVINTSGWGSQEWLAAVVLAFIFVTMGVVLWRIFGMFKLARRRRSAPNLRPLRRSRTATRDDNPPTTSWPMLALLAILVPFGVVTASLPAQAGPIITRHDVASGSYEIATSDFPAVFFLEQQGPRKVCVATLIHAQWAITAAHCLDETSLKASLESGATFQVQLANETRAIDAFVIHPLYDQASARDVDLALLRFTAPVPFPRPILLADGDVSVGQLIHVFGWGFTGQGLSGRDHDDGKFRRASNRLTQVDSRFSVLFDDPRVDRGSTEDLEGMPSLGDSGGPALISTPQGYVLGGITVGEVIGAAFNEETQGSYGAVAVFEYLRLHRDWISSVVGISLESRSFTP